MEIVSYDGQMLFGALITGVVAAYWIAIDSVRLRRALVAYEQDKDLTVRDRVFGSAIGILVGIVGVAGSLAYYCW
ncbi:MAG: hypothetical protein F9K40_05210 [Kofleriaceae bacterium]|nr:MAG: hypothetical protein F9K40_05210 [Kofleriaceae bacterium]MBZ0238524.1 hypothetical protein [Kofleriaceae bacterium]